jgi:transposase-like protein
MGAGGLVGDKLEELARQGAQAMLAAALEQEVDEFLQRARYVRGREFRGYRNGHAPERTVGVGVGAVPVRMPRVSDVPREVAPNGFESQIVGRYQRASEATRGCWPASTWKGYRLGISNPSFGLFWGRRRRCRRAASRG